MGFLAAMRGGPERDEGKNRWFLFRRVVDLDAVPETAETRVTVDGRYQLFVNGVRVGRGPVRCSPLAQKYDGYDLAPFLKPGRNVVGLVVHALGVDTSWYEMVRGMWRPTFGDGGVWVDGPVVRSDLGWRCLDCAAWERDVPRANHSIGFAESFDAGAFPHDWLDPAFDDDGWDAVQELVSGGGGPEALFGGLQTRPFPILLPSGIPPLAEVPVSPARLVWAKGVTPCPDLPFAKRIYEEPFAPLDGAVEGLDALVAGTGPAVVRTGTNDVSFLLDFGSIHTAYPAFEIDAQGGEIIDIAVSEQLPGEWDAGGPAPDARIERRPVLGLDAHLTRYVARPGRQRFERFEWQAVRWMQVTVRNAPGGLVFHQIGAVQTHYPAELAGAFASSDPMLDRLWAVGAETLKLCMHDGWEDCPSREQRQWLGDATVEQLVGQVAFSPAVNALNAKYLKDVADSQRPDGLTQMFAPGDHGVNGILIPDWTLQWVLNARNHLRWSGDRATVEAVFPAIERALAWFLKLPMPNGLVADLPYWHFMDWAGVGRAGEACTLNAQLAGALTAAAKIADALDNPGAGRRLREQADAIRVALERHWDAARGVYVDCVDPATGEQHPRVSQHANAAMILWGGAPPERWPHMIARMTDPARVTFTAAPPIVPTGATLDEVEGVVQANTFYSHFVYAALKTAGRTDLLLAQIRAHYGPMLTRGATTLWESFEPTASLCHGFSATPTYQLATAVCGLTPGADGFAALRFAPDIAGLRHAEATVETVAGTVRARLDAAEDGFDARLEVPDGMPVSVVAPPGLTTSETAPGHWAFRRV